jgi:hypothetical protein
MTQPLYDNEMLRRYLLGTASADEAARLDELSLTDDDCALALGLVENDLVDAYANESLAATERTHFERHYLASPLRREKAHFALELQCLGNQAAAPLTVINPEATRPATRFAWFKLTSVWQVGLATAALVLLAACVWLIVENQRLRQQAESERAALLQRESELKTSQTATANNQDELARLRERLAQLEARPATPATPPVAPATQLFTFTLAAPIRGADRLPKLEIPQQAATVAVKLELESGAYPHYRVALRDPLTNRVVWQSGKLAAVRGPNGATVTARVPSQLFAAQRYAFELSGLTADNAEERLSSYPFSVVRP